IYWFFTYSRHIGFLIYVTKYLTSDSFYASFFISHHTFGSGNNRNTQAVDHAWQRLMFYIFSQSWLAYPREMDDCILLGGRIVFQSDLNSALGTVIFKLVVLDISLIVKHFGHLFL